MGDASTPAGLRIDEEAEADQAVVRAILVEAFGQPAESRLVDRLREAGALECSFVARVDDVVTVGTIQGSPVTLEPPSDVRGLALAPLAVLPPYRSVGIGGALCSRLVEHAKDAGYDFIVVLGAPAYYHEFGFRTSTELGLGTTYDVPADVFMAMALTELPPLDAVVRYRPEFDGV